VDGLGGTERNFPESSKEFFLMKCRKLKSKNEGLPVGFGKIFLLSTLSQ
jgi:hypothetical protein